MKYFILSATFILVVLVIFAAMSVNATPKDVAWISHYQTLAAGILAVAAAALTVGAMFAVDVQQQARHLKIVNLAMKADRLKVERFAPLAIDEINRAVDAISGASMVMTDSPIDHILATHKTTHLAVTQAMHGLQLTSPIHDLFDSDLEAARRAVHDAYQQLIEPNLIIEEGERDYRAWHAKNREGDYAGPQVTKVAEAHERYRTASQALADEMQTFARRLQLMIDQYRAPRQ